MHNESAAVGAFLDSVEKAFTGLAFSWELIAVDDGSTDDTWRLLTDAAPSHPWLNGIRLARRFGQHPATIAGLEASRGEVVAVMDADMQVSAADVRRAVEMISPDVELVYAAREHSAEGFMRGVLGAWLSRLAARLLSHSAECPVSTFFAATRRVVERALEIERPRPVVRRVVDRRGEPTALSRRVELQHRVAFRSLPQDFLRLHAAAAYRGGRPDGGRSGGDVLRSRDGGQSRGRGVDGGVDRDICGRGGLACAGGACFRG
jgi:glycosyltransferase involved in cell wall biosynthesis